MKSHPRISETEWENHEVVWAKAPCSASDVIDAFKGRAWHPKTIKTYLTRLVNKEALDSASKPGLRLQPACCRKGVRRRRQRKLS
jgi:BlaI family penicillinase repressor